MPRPRGLRGFLVALYLLLTLGASTGVALQLYLMERLNPALQADCRFPGAEEDPSHLLHSLFCGLQIAEGSPPLALPPYRPLEAPLAPEVKGQRGYPFPIRGQASRAPPLGLGLL